MLNIYIGKDNIPEDKEIVLDNEAYFALTEISGNEFTREVIQNIEGGTYFDNISYLDRFGVKLYINALSTGSKTLLNLYYHPDKIFYCQEMGLNARRMIFKLKEGSALFNKNFNQFDVDDNLEFSVYVNNKICRSLHQVLEVIDNETEI